MNKEQKEFKKLHDLKEKGILTEEEFEVEKQKIFEAYKDHDVKPAYLSFSDKDFLMYMHLSCILGVIVPIVGFIVPYMIWSSHADHAETDRHGKVLLNWCASAFIYIVAASGICVVMFGLGLFLLAVVVFGFIGFCIYGGTKASVGELLDYPLTISFVAMDKK